MDLLVFLLQNTADVGNAVQQIADNGLNWGAVGGVGGGSTSVIAYYEWQKKQAKANTQLILDAISSLNSEHIKETHAVVTKENDQGQKQIHAASFKSDAILEVLKPMSENMTTITGVLAGMLEELKDIRKSH